MNFLRRLFSTYQIVATFHFKSGKSVSIKCNDISVKFNKVDGSLTSYTISEPEPGKILYMDMRSIEAITFEKN